MAMPQDGVQARLQALQAELDKARSARYSAEGQLAQLEQAEARLLREMEAEGVTPATITGVITQLHGQINQLLTQAEKLLSGELDPASVQLPEDVQAGPAPKAAAPAQPDPADEIMSLFAEDTGEWAPPEEGPGDEVPF